MITIFSTLKLNNNINKYQLLKHLEINIKIAKKGTFIFPHLVGKNENV